MPSRKVVTSKASELRRTVHIQEDVGISDTQGGHIPNWQDVQGLSHVPVAFRTMSAYENFRYDQLYPGVNTRMFMRYRGSVAVKAGMRVAWGNHSYRILGAENFDQDNNTIVLYCEELGATGSKRS